MSENYLCDIYRVRSPQSRRYTWRCKTPLIQRRLDYFLISDQLQGQIEAIDIIPSVQSDHSTVRMRVNETQHCTKGRSYWKFNNSLTQDDAFVQELKNEIPKFYSESSELADPVVKWDYLKYKVRQLVKKYSIDKAKVRRAKRNKLKLRVKKLEGLLSTDSQEIAKEYYDHKQELESIYNYIIEGIIMRSKTDWYEHGEKSTKYFLNLEKRNKAKSHIRKIITDDLREISDPEIIKSNLKNIYGTLYKSRSHKIESECLS